MLRVLHELSLWAAFAAIIGACIYVQPYAGAAVGVAGGVYIGLVQSRGRE